MRMMEMTTVIMMIVIVMTIVIVLIIGIFKAVRGVVLPETGELIRRSPAFWHHTHTTPPHHYITYHIQCTQPTTPVHNPPLTAPTTHPTPTATV